VAVENVDILIIGGGIHGAGVAQAAAADGYSSLVLEKSNLAGGTSSRSSKLIHGGLRYLESGQVGLVRESLHERQLLLKLAPQLVHPVPFYIPVYRDSRRGKWKIRLGLSLYSLIGGPFNPLMQFRELKRDEWNECKGLSKKGLITIFQYWDAQTDDAVLTRAVMNSAAELGSRLMCPAEILSAEQITNGYIVRYQHSSEEREIRCSFLVNAGGPWVNMVLEKVTPAAPRLSMDLVEGTHIIIEGKMHDKVFYLEAPSDGRAVFVMPWKNNTTLVGTTECSYPGDPDYVEPGGDEIEYLRRTIARYFPSVEIKVLDSFAGLRVLPRGKGRFFNRSRELILHQSTNHPRLLTVYGGKLTVYRNSAQKILDRIRPLLGVRNIRAKTDRLQLSMPED